MKKFVVGISLFVTAIVSFWAIQTFAASPLKAIKTFHYQLQDAKFEDLKNLHVDALVVDIDDVELTKSQIATLQKQNKIVLSYLSIGEAEDYRSYWQDSWEEGSPSFLDKENPDWEGNFKVKYWDREWQNIMLKRVEAIARAGYSGVYLDIIDGYEYYAEKGRMSAAKDMINFVSRISKKAKSINPNFLIVPQNAPELYKYHTYKKLVDGFGKEDTWYNDDDKQSVQDRRIAMKYLRQADKDGKFVLSIDYPTKRKNICDFYKKCQTEGFACTVSDRDLTENKPLTCK